MYSAHLLALAASISSVFTAPHAALSARDTASNIQAIEVTLNNLINDIVLGTVQSNTDTISSSYTTVQSQLVDLSESLGISGCGQGTPQPPATADDAISALQETQLGLNVVAQDVINSDPELQSAFCSAVGWFSAVSCFAGIDSPIIGVIGGCPAGGGSSGSGTSTPSVSATGCQDQYDSCRSVTDVNNPPNYSFCAAQYSQCQSDCQTAFGQCATAPDANHAYCASQEAACLGYNPFDSGSSTTSESESVTTPAPTSSAPTTSAPSSSPTAGSCQDSYNSCVTGSDPNFSSVFLYCASQFAGCKSTCTSAWEACSTAPDANHAFCASQYSACLGYYPFNTTSTTVATTSSLSFGCNPAHSYPTAVTCILVNGTYEFSTFPVASATAT